MQIFKLSRLFMLTLVFLTFGCSSDSDSDTDNNNNNNEPNSITLTANTANAEEGDTIIFTVKTNSNEDVTSQSTIKVNGNEISGSSWITSTHGDFSVTAKYNNLTSNVVTVQVQESLTSIVLTANSNQVFVGDEIIFSVAGNNGDNLTSAATITYNGINIGGNGYTATTSGLYEFVATYDAFTSNTLEVNVLPPPTKFSRNVLIEDYTGTWCGYCPRVAYAIEQVESQTDKVVVVATHLSSQSTPDPYHNSTAVELANAFNVSGLPTANLNRTTTWNYPEPNNVNQALSLTVDNADLGIALSPSVNGNNLNVEVKVKIGELFLPGSAKLVVFLLEDGLIYNQTNYTSYYGGTSTISNFEHNGVLRASFTDVLGDAIPANQLTGGNVYTTTLSMSLPSTISNSNNIKVVAIVTESNNTAINSREAHFGDSQTFEEI